MKKICSKCKQKKPIKNFRRRSQFALYKNVLSSYQSYCKKCERRYWRESDASRFGRRAHNLKRKYGGIISSSDLRKLGDPDICYLCGDKIKNGDAEYDHIVPRGAGGVLGIENIRWTHRRCNRMKHDLTIKELVILLRKILNKIG